MRKKPKMILFDYGGTLLREPGWNMLRGEEALFKHVLVNPHSYTPAELCAWEREYFQSLQPIRNAGAELSEIQMMRLKYELHGIRLDISYEEAEEIFWDYTAPMTEACLVPNIKKVLEKLRLNGIRTGVVSNIGWTGAALKRRIDTLLPEHSFEFILASSDYGMRKPNARLFHVALEKAGLMPAEVWFCGDTYDTDIEGASAIGLTSVYYQGAEEKTGEMQAPRKDISKAAFAIRDWMELISILAGCC